MMNPLTHQQHASAHARWQSDEGVHAPAVEGVEPHEIIGYVTVTLNFSCIRACDQGRPHKGRNYLLPLRMPYAGSEFLLQHLPNEMDGLVNQVLKKVRAWEWRSRQDRDRQSKVIKRPGT